MLERMTLCSATLGEDGRLEPPLGPLYIASALESVGVEIDFRDYQLATGANCFSAQPLVEFLVGHERVVAISCFVDMLPAVIAATARLHESRPDTRFILGGPGPSGSASRILELYPWIEGVVRGEGEETIQEWANRQRGHRRELMPIAGMTYREDGRIVEGPDRQRLTELEAIAPPAYHLVDQSVYSLSRVVTTRGCAYRCSFCDVGALWGNRSVYRDIDNVIDEILAFRDQLGRKTFAIVDDTFVQDRRRVRAFCQGLIDRKAGLFWSCFGRINLMTPELVDLMAEAGCRSVFYGIDSGSQAVVARTHKMVRPEIVVPVVRYSAAVFDNVEASFIWGYPFEELDDFKMTLDLVAECAQFAPRVNVQLHRLIPLPNSPIYQEFPGPLLEPDPADRPWLLLPSILLDKRAEALGQLIRAAPDVYPGFFTLPTPSIAEKRAMLNRVVRSLDSAIGATMLDPDVARLLDVEVPEAERALLSSVRDAPERIGKGLAVSFFRRSRRRRTPGAGASASFAGDRGPSLVRQRNDRSVKGRAS